MPWPKTSSSSLQSFARMVALVCGSLDVSDVSMTRLVRQSRQIVGEQECKWVKCSNSRAKSTETDLIQSSAADRRHCRPAREGPQLWHKKPCSAQLGKTSKTESKTELWISFLIQRTILGSQWGEKKTLFPGGLLWPSTQQMKSMTPKCSFCIRDVTGKSWQSN